MKIKEVMGGKAAINCRTQEDCIAFLKGMENVLKITIPYPYEEPFNRYGVDTCFTIYRKSIPYGNVDYYRTLANYEQGIPVISLREESTIDSTSDTE